MEPQTTIPPHPYGVEPAGSAFARNMSIATSRRGLGQLATVDDATVLHALGYADGAALCALAIASGALRCFASTEDLWRGVALRRAGDDGAITYRGGSWKQSVVGAPRANVAKRLFSDALYHSHRLVHAAPLSSSGLGSCARRRAADLSVDAFVEDFERAGVPVVIEGAAADAAAQDVWDRDVLQDRLGARVFHVGGYAFGLAEFLQYAENNADDTPLYLFDKRFAEAAPELAAAYKPPKYFDDDLFGLLEGRRPDWRWLIVGGARSGSAWHKDPNGTSAWNATLRGRKRWLFFPPRTTPPGVRPSADGLDLVAPLSIAEWAWTRAFYAEAKAHPHFVEAHSGPGDVVFVPRGWWHCVVNQDAFTVAVTHNFCSPRGLSSTLGLLRQSPHLVSGLVRDERVDECDDLDEVAKRAVVGAALHDRLVAALRRRRPDALAAAEADLARPTTLWGRLTAEPDLVATGVAPKRARVDDGASGGFAFGFR